MKLTAAAISDIGRQRTGNEDAFLSDEPVFAVADGMGGHLAGEVASETAISVVSSRSSEAPDELDELLREANRTIWDKAQLDSKLRGMGTTCTMVVIEDSTAHIAHVGDSRLYLLRAEALQQITEDHTLVARMVKEGRLSAADAQHHPQRSVITRALGVDEDVEVDLLELQLQEGDRLLLCSDGLSGMVDAADIESTLVEVTDTQRAAEKLVELANAGGGEDNITVILVDVGELPQGVSVEQQVIDAAEGGQGLPVERAGFRGRKALLVTVSSLVVLGALYAGAAYAINNVLWFVGVDEAGRVTVFHGIPEEVAGLDLKRPEQQSDLVADDLPEFAREDVISGHKVDSLDAGLEYIANLKERALDFTTTPSPKATRK